MHAHAPEHDDPLAPGGSLSPAGAASSLAAVAAQASSAGIQPSPCALEEVHVGAVTGGLEWTDEIGLDPDLIYASLDLGPLAPRIRTLVSAR